MYLKLILTLSLLNIQRRTSCCFRQDSWRGRCCQACWECWH